jgi:hypothetical protein
MCLAAYNRNKDSWHHPHTYWKAISERFASNDATSRLGLEGWDPTEHESDFILIMTNFSPFITRLEWQALVQARPRGCSELVDRWPATAYLDDLYDAIGDSVDLWMGHSAVDGTRWVWPGFEHFVRRRGIQEWMLTPNLSPRSHLYLDGAFRKSKNPRFSLFGPEKGFAVVKKSLRDSDPSSTFER